jgi:hypothetical protein
VEPRGGSKRQAIPPLECTLYPGRWAWWHGELLCGGPTRIHAVDSCERSLWVCADVRGKCDCFFFPSQISQVFDFVLPACWALSRASVRRTDAVPLEGRARVRSVSASGFPSPRGAHQARLTASCGFVRWSPAHPHRCGGFVRAQISHRPYTCAEILEVHVWTSAISCGGQERTRATAYHRVDVCGRCLRSVQLRRAQLYVAAWCGSALWFRAVVSGGFARSCVVLWRGHPRRGSVVFRFQSSLEGNQPRFPGSA